MNLIIAQSGGPTSVINSSLAGAISAGIVNNFENIYLSLHGIEGILEDEVLSVDKDKFESKDIKTKLMARPSSILGSCRYKLPEDFSNNVYGKIFKTLKKYEISTFVYIGGNDSMDTVMKLNNYMDQNGIEGINILGCPKTIDNDLMEMDHSPGFASTAKFVAQTLRAMRTDVDIYDLKSVTFVEIMGRNAGWLAASSLVANYKMEKDVVNLVYVPEKSVKLSDMVGEIKDAFESEPNLIVAIAEGFMDSEEKLALEKFQNTADGFNHKIVSGLSARLADMMREDLGVKSRAVELNIPQRTGLLISKTDAKEAYTLGYKAVEIGIKISNQIPVLKRKEGLDYEVYYESVHPDQIANKESVIPEEWLESKDTLEEKMIAYTLPLIQGEVEQIYKDGMPVFVNLDEFVK